MRLITRNDATLAVALIAATVVVFQQPLRYAFDLAQDVQERYHVDLLPALTILTCVFIFHQSRKRQQAKADARTAAAEAAQARLRSAELERLMSLGQALGNALDPLALQQVLWRHLPTFAPSHECWMLVRKGTRWEPLLQDRASAATESFDAMETIADRILSADAPADARREGILDRETLCYPLHAGGAVVGMLGVENAAALPAGERKALGAAAAVMAIAVRNVQLILATQEESMRDSLTGCFTRKYALDQLDRCMRLSRRSARPLSIVMFDIDRFKQVNDELGHLRGDELLRAVGQKLTSVLRSTDFRCRYGGDEFMIICPDTPVLGAQQVAECLRREIATLAIDANGTAQRVSASFGVAADVAGNEIDVEALIQRADAELYRAKHAGRNRVCVAADAATSPKVEQIAARPRFISAVS